MAHSEREILPEIGSVLLADLKPSQFIAAIVPIRKRAPRVTAMGISALRGVIRHAHSMNRLDLDVADPTAGIPTVPQGKRNRPLSDPEIGADTGLSPHARENLSHLTY